MTNQEILTQYKRIGRKTMCPEIEEVLKQLNSNCADEPLKPFETFRVAHRRPIEYRFDEKDNRKRKYKEPDSQKETMMQRHIFFASEKYKKEFGHLIGYEVEIPREGRMVPIDLIGIDVKGGKCTIFLIEMKKMGNSDTLLHAMCEISTYKIWFMAALKCEADGLKEKILQKALDKKIDVTLEEIKNAIVQLVIVGSKEMIKQKEYFKDYDLGAYQIYAIDKSSAYREGISYDSKEKLYALTKL